MCQVSKLMTTTELEIIIIENKILIFGIAYVNANFRLK